MNPINWNSRNMGLYAILFLAMASLAFIRPLMYGISAPEPVGPYLNGAFPSHFASNWTASPYTGLHYDDVLALTPEPRSTRFYVVTREGIIYHFNQQASNPSKTTWLNISSNIWKENGQIVTGTETGIFGFAFHPEFGLSGSPNRGYAYLYYVTEKNNTSYIRLSRFTQPDGQQTADPNSEQILFDQKIGTPYHRGGGLFFGNDGFLYLSIGDLQMQENAQKIHERFISGVLRIDVDQNPGRSHPIIKTLQSVDAQSFSGNYYIPNDNPFLSSNGGNFEEYYAVGLRNPHRMTKDMATGDIYIGDVGSNNHSKIKEELNKLIKGANYGWPFREGYENLQSQPGNITGTLTDPLLIYPHSSGNECIIGGYVYRGTEHPSLIGKYIFGDYGSGRIWASSLNGSIPLEKEELTSFSAGGLATFGQDLNGEIYMGSILNGKPIYKLSANNQGNSNPPQWLSQTGAFTNLSSLQPSSGLIPYTVNSPLWSDGAEKMRWVAIPNDGSYNSSAEEVDFSENEEWDFPVGTVFIKHFELPTDENNPNITHRLETRFLIRANNGEYYGLTYKWLPNGSDAELLAGSFQENITIQTAGGGTRTQEWYYPSRSDCFICHTDASGRVLGVKTRQLNGDLLYSESGETANQLATWNHLGIFNPNINESAIAGYLTSKALDDNTASLELRARSYLDANCAGCHRPNGGARGHFDTRLNIPLGSQALINGEVIDDMGINGSKVIVPGDLGKSILYQRMNTSSACCSMPPLGRNLKDESAIQLIGDWIMSMDPGDPCVGGATVTYLSDLSWTSATNGWGNVELDQSVGEQGSGDGNTMTIEGQTYQKGLGVHANSTIVYNLGAQYSMFKSDIGVDDETCGSGSVIFKVITDGNLAYQSQILSQSDPAVTISVDLTGVQELILEVTDGGNNIWCDHADWADARLEGICSGGGPNNQPPTAAFTANPTNGTAPLTVSFDASASSDPDGDPLSYQWDFGDGVSATGEMVTHSYTQSGSYTAVLTVNDGNGGTDLANQNIQLSPTPPPPPPPCSGGEEITYLSDINWVSAQNNYGPVKLDQSNGNNILTINGQTYAKGLGAHAPSEIVYQLNGQYNSFKSDIGVDDETCDGGSVIFIVQADGNQIYQSSLLTQADPAASIDLNIQGVNELKLIVDKASNNYWCDHADWADARLVSGCDSTGPPPPPPSNQSPVASFSVSQDTGTAPVSVSFNASASSDPDGDNLSYSWNFGDGNSATGVSVSHTYTQAGNFNAILTVDDGNGGTDANSQFIEVFSPTTPPPPPPCNGQTTTYLSDINWTSADNNYGPVKLDLSNGNNPLTINGQVYSKGLGAHAPSDIVYQLNGQYDRFKSDVGIDDETCASGSVIFEVWADGVMIYQSPLLTQADDAVSIDLNIQGVNELRLIVDKAANNYWCDHADWADARLESGCNTQSRTAFASMQDFSVHLYPNPNQGDFLLELNGLQENTTGQMEIWDMHGKQVMRSTILEAVNRIQLRDLASGVYLLKVQVEGINKHVKLTIWENR